MYPDQKHQNVGPDLDPNCLNSDSVPEIYFEKKSADDKYAKLTSMQPVNIQEMQTGFRQDNMRNILILVLKFQTQ